MTMPVDWEAKAAELLRHLEDVRRALLDVPEQGEADDLERGKVAEWLRENFGA